MGDPIYLTPFLFLTTTFSSDPETISYRPGFLPLADFLLTLQTANLAVSPRPTGNVPFQPPPLQTCHFDPVYLPFQPICFVSTANACEWLFRPLGVPNLSFRPRERFILTPSVHFVDLSRHARASQSRPRPLAEACGGRKAKVGLQPLQCGDPFLFGTKLLHAENLCRAKAHCKG